MAKDDKWEEWEWVQVRRQKNKKDDNDSGSFAFILGAIGVVVYAVVQIVTFIYENIIVILSVLIPVCILCALTFYCSTRERSKFFYPIPKPMTYIFYVIFFGIGIFIIVGLTYGQPKCNDSMAKEQLTKLEKTRISNILNTNPQLWKQERGLTKKNHGYAPNNIKEYVEKIEITYSDFDIKSRNRLNNQAVCSARIELKNTNLKPNSFFLNYSLQTIQTDDNVELKKVQLLSRTLNKDE